MRFTSLSDNRPQRFCVEIADLATYLRSAWSTTAGAVSHDKVADTRSTVVAARR